MGLVYPIRQAPPFPAQYSKGSNLILCMFINKMSASVFVLLNQMFSGSVMQKTFWFIYKVKLMQAKLTLFAWRQCLVFLAQYGVGFSSLEIMSVFGLQACLILIDNTPLRVHVNLIVCLACKTFSPHDCISINGIGGPWKGLGLSSIAVSC